ncbi:protein MIX23-like [Paramacrobiotus metropolitanus]|uniref:protein MIX23-like n=1 Tax=Paramacrobiotus metropolitanus TaxID=2943436 RepID=UPI0024461816|nr:protein MIX23-like [Paramacrobiotus metropolitanus]
MAHLQPHVAKELHQAATGETYVRSAAEPVPASISCEDFSAFQETLKNLRQIDDRIVYLLNTTIPTDSFSSQANPKELCRKLFSDLQSSYLGREKAIRKCVDVTAERISQLKERRNQSSESSSAQNDILKSLRKEQTKLRLMQSELNVEEVVKDRTLKVFHDRCKLHYQPPLGNSL